jgi:pentatricopeptide repeat protein
MGYAIVGDFVGIEKSVENLKAVGYVPTVECANYVLKSVVMSNTGITWEEFFEVYSKYFGPDGLTADNETYTQLLLACIKYDHADEAITFFNDLLTSGVTPSPILKNLFRQVVDCDEFNALHPDIPDTWIPLPGAPNPRGADHLPLFHLLWGSSRKRIRRSKVAKPDSQIRKLPLEKVNGIDTDDVTPPSVVVYNDLETLKHSLKARDDSGIKNIGSYLMSQFIAAYSDLKDPDSAYKLLLEREAMGFNPERHVFRAMAKAFADVGDYEKTREVYNRFVTSFTGSKCSVARDRCVDFCCIVSVFEVLCRGNKSLMYLSLTRFFPLFLQIQTTMHRISRLSEHIASTEILLQRKK